MRCSEAVKLLDGFRTQELGKHNQEQLAAHLAVCGECAGELKEITHLADNMTGLHVEAPAAVLVAVARKTSDRYAAVATDLGRIWVGFSIRGVTMVFPQAKESAEFESIYQDRYGRRPIPGELPAVYAGAIAKAAAGRAGSHVPVDLSAVSDFDQKALLLLRRIPRGEVRPYSWLAREAGHPRAVRAIGNAMARNPVPLLLPCHRVVPAVGGVGGYAFGAALKRELLAREGAPIEEMERYAREGVRYIGCKTTHVYCLPSCHDVRRVRPQNRVPLPGAAEAAGAGFRPCRHCKP